jgi:hypothetical protein
MTDSSKRKPGSSDEENRREWDRQDDEVADITRTVQPKSDPPSRSGIAGEGSGADTLGT